MINYLPCCCFQIERAGACAATGLYMLIVGYTSAYLNVLLIVTWRCPDCMLPIHSTSVTYLTDAIAEYTRLRCANGNNSLGSVKCVECYIQICNRRDTPEVVQVAEQFQSHSAPSLRILPPVPKYSTC